MRKTVLGVAALGLAATFAIPAQADHAVNRWHPLTFTAGVPCAFACPYWLDDANTDIDGNGQEDIFFATCANPGGTNDILGDAPGLPYEDGTVFQDFVTHRAPSTAQVLIFEIFPNVDFDSFICSQNGEQELAVGANELGQNCDNIIGPQNPVPVACTERASITVASNQRYRLRVYNWSDAVTVAGQYCYSTAGSCTN